MFSLIIALVSIVIVGALVLAVVYYGGDAFTNSGTKAEVARIHNEAAQIAGAANLYRVERGAQATNISDLVSAHYLAASPGPNWQAAQDAAVLTGLEQSRCEQINAKLGISGVPSCTDAAIVGKPACCSETT